MSNCRACDPRRVADLPCDQPVLTIGFPTNGRAIGMDPNVVVLANGAVVDLNELGRIIMQCCPAFVNGL